MYIMCVKINEIDKIVGMNIRLMRVKKSLSQERLAELSQISPTTMGAVERGDQSSTVQTLARIANALNVDLYKLFIIED